MNKKIYNVRGMHCRSCEIVIEDSIISKVEGVKKVDVNYRKGLVRVYYDQQTLSDGQIRKVIEDAGYGMGIDSKRPFVSKDSMVYIELIFAGGILLFVYFLMQIFGVFKLSYGFGNSPGLIAVVLIGLTAGVSTCMALVGGIILGISARHSTLHPEATSAQKFRPHLFFNAGRLSSYLFFGGIIGLVGSAFRFSSSVLGTLIVIVGIVMLFLGLKLIEVFPRLEGLTLPKSIGRFFGINRETKEYSHKDSFLTGAATFFLPCGFTQAMQLYAVSTGSFTRGSLIMGLFALGTMPGLLGIGGITSVVKGWFKGYFFKFAGLIVIILGLLNISYGYNLTGITFGGLSIQNQNKISGTFEEGKQIVKITQFGNGYSPNIVTVKVGVPVKLLVNATNLYSCSASLVISKYNIFAGLKEGINEFEFTPTSTGPVKFSCSMGMYTGVINVIN
jgi:sulfite exporter TauE/SafE/copper chaperone CopZ